MARGTPGAPPQALRGSWEGKRTSRRTLSLRRYEPDQVQRLPRCISAREKPRLRGLLAPHPAKARWKQEPSPAGKDDSARPGVTGRTFPFSDSGRPIGCDRLPGSWVPASRLPVVSLRSTTGYHLGPLGGVLGVEDQACLSKINPSRKGVLCAAVVGGGEAPNGSLAIPGGYCSSGRFRSAVRPHGGLRPKGSIRRFRRFTPMWADDQSGGVSMAESVESVDNSKVGKRRETLWPGRSSIHGHRCVAAAWREFCGTVERATTPRCNEVGAGSASHRLSAEISGLQEMAGCGGVTRAHQRRSPRRWSPPPQFGRCARWLRGGVRCGACIRPAPGLPGRSCRQSRWCGNPEAESRGP